LKSIIVFRKKGSFKLPFNFKEVYRLSVYSIVTDRIIHEMNQGVIPWHKPWMSMGVQSGAFNRVSKRPYSLLNQLLLRYEGEYATIKQWAKIGGKIKKGSKSEIVIFWKLNQQEKKDADGNIEIVTIPILKYYRVFHITSVEGVDPLEKPKKNNAISGIVSGDTLIQEYAKREHIDIQVDQFTDRAFYSPIHDYIKAPCKDQYNDIHEFYSTVFHEMAHSTGHQSRLNRNFRGVIPFGSEAYGMEELIAEIASAMVLHITGIGTSGTIRNSAAYLRSWIRALQEDDHLIVIAAAKAEKAVKYILG